MISFLCSCPFQCVVAAVLVSAGVTLNSAAEAQCYVPKNTNEQTIAVCTALIQSGRESGHNLAEDYHGRGDAYSQMKNYDRAIADFSEALRIDPKNVSIVIDRGTAYKQKGDNDRAIADYDQAIQLNPQYAGAYNGRCWDRALTGHDLALALDDCNEAVRLRPTDASMLNSRGLVQLKLGAFDRAMADYGAAVAQNAKDADSLYGRGVAKLKRGDTASGEADIAAAKALKADIANDYAGYGVK